MASKLEQVGVTVILIQIHEAHSDAWPVGLRDQPKPHADLVDRVRRANQFVHNEHPPYDVYIDGWNDQFEQTFRAWPDKYYYVDTDKRILQTSTYGIKADALIDYDCKALIHDLCKA
jgi:hypothetical protein